MLRARGPLVDNRRVATRDADLGGRRIAAGDRVRILEGPFRDVEGVLQQVRGEDRALVLLQILSDTRRVSVPAEQLQRVDAPERKAG